MEMERSQVDEVVGRPGPSQGAVRRSARHASVASVASEAWCAFHLEPAACSSPGVQQAAVWLLPWALRSAVAQRVAMELLPWELTSAVPTTFALRRSLLQAHHCVQRHSLPMQQQHVQHASPLPPDAGPIATFLAVADSCRIVRQRDAACWP